MGVNSRIKMIFGIFLMLVFVACAMAPEVNMNKTVKTETDYKVAKIKPPRYIVQKKKPRIVVLPVYDATKFGNTSSAVSKQMPFAVFFRKCDLATMARGVIENVLFESGAFDVVERSRVNALVKELGFQETHGLDMDKLEKMYFALGKNIRYAVAATITSANVDKITAANSVAKVSMTVQIVDLKNGKVVQSFDVEGSYSQGTGVNAANCGALQKALKDALKCPLLVKLRDTIPMYGYIKEIRTYREGKNKVAKILFVNLGSRDGIQPGDKVKIVQLERSVDPITKKRELRYIEIGEGVVSKTGFGMDESVVLVEDPVVVKKVRVGDLVRPTSSKIKNECLGKKMLQGATMILREKLGVR